MLVPSYIHALYYNTWPPPVAPIFLCVLVCPWEAGCPFIPCLFMTPWNPLPILKWEGEGRVGGEGEWEERERGEERERETTAYTTLQ